MMIFIRIEDRGAGLCAVFIDKWQQGFVRREVALLAAPLIGRISALQALGRETREEDAALVALEEAEKVGGSSPTDYTLTHRRTMKMIEVGIQAIRNDESLSAYNRHGLLTMIKGWAHDTRRSLDLETGYSEKGKQ